MQFKTLLAASFLFATSVFAMPQAAASSTDTATTPAQTVAPDQLCMGTKTWVVNVSDTTGALKFSPNNVAAAAGECVQFQFWQKNHSVVQGDFANPCQPVQNNAAAFYSGYMPVDATTAGKLTFTVKVTDTTPKWFYCSQAKHCQEGMVGAINAPSTGNTVAAFAQAASQAQSVTNPSSAGGVAASGSSAAPSSTAGAVGQSSSALSFDTTRTLGAWSFGLLGTLAFLLL